MLKLFIRQPLTRSGAEEERIVQAALDILLQISREGPLLELLTGSVALSGKSFQQDFEARTGQAFSPLAFRRHRLELLAQADAFINLRVGLSESTGFEIGYNLFGGRRAPMFFAIWKQTPMKTTLLKELGEFCPVRYVEFREANELKAPLQEFLGNIAASAPGSRLS